VADFDADQLRSVLQRFATGVAVVTTWEGDRPWGTTVNSFSSVSLRPPLVMVALDRGRRIVPALGRSGRYAVNILGEEHRALADCFSGGPPPGQEPGASASPEPAVATETAIAGPLRPAIPGLEPRAELCGTDWRRGATGLPVLAVAIASLECTVVDVHAAGDHDLYIARVDAAAAKGERPLPLLYYSGRYLRIERAGSHQPEGKPER
jgi:3-hydroxy-9,10-secoandrosta-1,3,5(10)-triene-9,17-dione monooxygenase reductase component